MRRLAQALTWNGLKTDTEMEIDRGSCLPRPDVVGWQGEKEEEEQCKVLKCRQLQQYVV